MVTSHPKALMIRNMIWQVIAKLGIGVFILVGVIWGYAGSPRSFKEYTFLSNLIEGLVLVVAAVLPLVTGRQLPTWLDLALVIMALIMLGIVVTNYHIFNFAGAFLLLHVINPVLVFSHWLVVTEKGRIGPPARVLTVAVAPLCYIVFLLIHGQVTGDYIYSIFDVATLGWPHVGVFIAAVSAVAIGLAYALDAADTAMARRFAKTSPLKGGH